jgi:hypothetical protein
MENKINVENQINVENRINIENQINLENQIDMNNWDIFNDFVKHDNINSTAFNNNFTNEHKSIDNNELENYFITNENLRTHIKLSIGIYKKINNFDNKYIYNLINE